MFVAALQFDLAWEDPDENFRRVRPLAARAKAAGAELLALPEMFSTGFTMNATAAAKHAAATRAFLGTLARELHLNVVGGFAEPGRPRPKNALALYGSDGRELLHYQKVHPFSLAGEDRHFSGGDELATATIDGVRVTPLICYDLRFPELFRAAAARTDLFVVIANWPEKRRHAWSTLLAARAIENQCFVLGVNRVGESGGAKGPREPHSGDSALFDPFGVLRASASQTENVIVGCVDAAEVAQIRERFPFLKDRRPDLYARL